MSMIRRLGAALGANLTGQAVTTVMQLATLPLFLYCWSLEKYGSWLVLTAVPAYFALSDVGFLAVTINKMTIVAASGDKSRVNVLFQTAIKLCLIAALTATLFASIIAYSFDTWPLDSFDGKATLVILVFAAVLAMSSGLVDAVFRSSGEFASGTHLVTVGRLIEWAGMLCGLLLGRTFLSTAIGQLVGRVVAAVIGWRVASRRHPGVQWGIKCASGQEFRAMVWPALSFMAFPVANAISIQGMTLVVGHIFGPAFLAVFSTYRTVSRVLVQGVAVISRSLWPEISRRYGAGQSDVVIAIYRKGTLASIALALGLCTFMYFFGGALVNIWTSGRIPFEKGVFLLFLMVAVTTSFWQMGMVLLAATNKHNSLSITYLLGSIGCVAVAYLLSEFAGQYAPVLGLISFEVLLAVMCLVHVGSFKRELQGVA